MKLWRLCLCTAVMLVRGAGIESDDAHLETSPNGWTLCGACGFGAACREVV